MSNVFDYSSFYKRSRIPNPCLSYDQMFEEDIHYYILEQFGDYDEALLHGMYFDEVIEEDINENERQAIHREAVNAFLTRVCDMIGVDPSEAIAQEFRYYSDMVDWLRHTYHDRVIDLYETKLEKYYQVICEAFYARSTNTEIPISSDRPQREIAKKIQHILRTIINSSAWWDSNIVWILDLSDENVSTTLTNMMIPEELEDELSLKIAKFAISNPISKLKNIKNILI